MWIRLVNLALGIWLMAAPAVLGYRPPAADFHRIIGPTAAAVAVIAMTQVTRPMRWINLILGASLIAGAGLLNAEPVAALTGLITGAAMAVFSVPRGRIQDSFGGGWRALTSRRIDPSGQ